MQRRAVAKPEHLSPVGLHPPAGPGAKRRKVQPCQGNCPAQANQTPAHTGITGTWNDPCSRLAAERGAKSLVIIMNVRLEELRKLLLQSGPSVIHVPKKTPEKAHETGDPAFVVFKNSPAKGDEGVSASLTGRVLNYVSSESETEETTADNPYTLALAVSKVFEPASGFRDRLDELMKAADEMERLIESSSLALGAVREFHDRIETIANVLAPMKSVEREVARLAQNFVPMRDLHEQLGQVTQAFDDNLTEMARCLEPARRLQAKVEQLSEGFKSLSALQERFSKLAETFRASARMAPVPNA